MEVKGKKIGFVLTTESIYALKKVIKQIKIMKGLGADILPIISNSNYNNIIEKITEKKIMCTINEAEKIGIEHLTDIIVIAPASTNIISKLTYNIADTPETIAVKSHSRNDLPIVIAPCTNTGLRRRFYKYSYFGK